MTSGIIIDMKECILCKKEIMKNPEDSWKIHENRKFCNAKCYHTWQDKFRKIKTKNSMEKICRICNNIFYTTQGRDKVCSEKCKLKRKRQVRNIHSKKTHIENRLKAIEHYGGKCTCCGESQYEFLAIDHIDKTGGKERKNITTRAFYNNFRKGLFPKNYQLLCHNCNCAKGFYGQCPHEYNSKIKPKF